jgi:hypothetical protein
VSNLTKLLAVPRDPLDLKSIKRKDICKDYSFFVSELMYSLWTYVFGMCRSPICSVSSKDTNPNHAMM